MKEIRTKYEQLQDVMDERVTRLWAASEAQALGRGDIAAVVKATGISKSRVRAGIADLEKQRLEPSISPARAQRVRRPGAGRPPLLEKGPTLLDDLDRLIEPVTRSDPESPLRWTCKSKDKLAAELNEMGHKVSATKVGRLLHDLVCLLPSWPKARVLEFAPAYWKQTLEQRETQEKLAANLFRRVLLDLPT